MFALEFMSLPHKKSIADLALQNYSNADFAPQNHKVFVRCSAKSQSLRSLLRKIIKPLFFAQQNYKAMQTVTKKEIVSKFDFFFVKQGYFRYL